jgi:hypothetical protein
MSGYTWTLRIGRTIGSASQDDATASRRKSRVGRKRSIVKSDITTQKKEDGFGGTAGKRKGRVWILLIVGHATSRLVLTICNQHHRAIQLLGNGQWAMLSQNTTSLISE